MSRQSQVNGNVYDPDQDPEEKRNLRRRYRSLYKATTEGEAHLCILRSHTTVLNYPVGKMHKAMQETLQRSNS